MKKLTITVEDAVYDGLQAHIGAGRISRFVNDLVRPFVDEADLEAEYRAMAADVEREREAEEWCEALIGDILIDDE